MKTKGDFGFAPVPCAQARIDCAKAIDGSSDPGGLTGYLAVFGNVDRYDEVIRRGAFTKTINDLKGKSLPLMIRHFVHGGGTSDCVGSIREFMEDDYGLMIRAEFARDELSQRVRGLVSDGHVQGLSVGYQIIDAGGVEIGGKVVLELRELKLREGTITVNPVNEEAFITAAKSLDFAFEEIRAGRIGNDRAPLHSLQESLERLSSALEASKSVTTPPCGGAGSNLLMDVQLLEAGLARHRADL